ncbi:MAG: dienelactone hydrolase family protein [Proteobacteria bacterium]|nr:dienelactone hydrolase family protein [Pseudomonadota bacterium]
MRASIALALCLLGLPAQAQPACGDAATECLTAHGFYRLALPEGAAGPVPALIHLHGWGGSSAATMKNRAMRAALAARGYALVAPEGIRTSAARKQKNWAVRDGRAYERDDLAFLAEVLDDAAAHGIDRDRVLMTGFSRGASMVWDVACHAPGTARAYAPVAGAFWEPLPESCQGGADLFHTHGWADRVIPLEGRSVAGGTLTQGDTFASLKILRAANGCETEQPDASRIEPGGHWRRTWSSCSGGRIELMLHPGPHGTPNGWLERALDWFEARLAEG